MSVLRVLIKKPVVLLDDPGRDDETVLLDERPQGVAKPLLLRWLCRTSSIVTGCSLSRCGFSSAENMPSPIFDSATT